MKLEEKLITLTFGPPSNAISTLVSIFCFGMFGLFTFALGILVSDGRPIGSILITFGFAAVAGLAGYIFYRVRYYTWEVRRIEPSSSSPGNLTNVQQQSSPTGPRRGGSHFSKWTFIQCLLIGLAVFGFASMLVHPGSAAPTGSQYDHVVIIAMENQNYASVLGSGSGSSSAPFISSLLSYGATIPNYHSYGSGIGGCSAGCYQAFVEGTQTVSDGWCPRANSPCRTATTIADQLGANGLTSAAFCEDGCPRGADHFPFIGYTSTWNSCVTGTFSCNGQVTSSGLVLYSSTSSNSGSFSTVTFAGNSAFINYLNGGNPANYIWFTPNDSHNMHDNSIQSGDQYLQSLLIGTGSLASPSTTSVLGTSLFQGASRTIVYLWWDEYDPSPNLIFDYPISRNIVKNSFVSSATNYNEYASLHTIENNWGLQGLQNAASAPIMSDLFGATGPTPLSTSFTFTAPTVAPTTVSFTGTATGGTGPYTFSWNFGDSTTGTGSSPSHTYTQPGSFSVAETTSDSAGHTATSTQSLTVPVTGCAPNCPPPLNPGQLVGWGGIRLDEASTSGLRANTLNLPSCCFSGEFATNMQLEVQRQLSLGYNTVRVDFDPTCTDNTDFNYMSAYSATNLQRAITIAQFYNTWIIIDYHGYTDIIAGSSTGLVQSGYSDLRSCWLGVWSPIVSQFKNSYAKLIWEPLNEPKPVSGSDVATLSSGYQAWINQARNLGDTHWIIVGNICSFGCTLSDYSQGYPTVTDPSNHVFINLHAYMGYPYISPWTISEADVYAYQYYQWVLSGQTRTGWPSLNTETGADPLCSLTACPNAGWGNCSTPATTCGGSAGYTAVTFEFVKYLTNLFNTNNPPISWIGWTAGSWTDTPGAPLYGALDPTNWGTMLGTVSPGGCTGSSCPPPPPCSGGGFICIFYNPINAAILAAGVLSVIAVGALVGGRKRKSTGAVAK